jgi:hypothetical protein
MTNQINLKEIERKAFRSTYQDGLWDLYLGLVVVAMAIFIYRPPEGYGPANIFLMIAAFSLAYALFWAGKKFITLPRMGQVRFGPRRKRRALTLALILGAVVLVQAGVVALSVLGWLNPQVGAAINNFLQDRDVMDLAVAAIGALFIGPSMILIAYLTDFPRGYYIAIMMSLAVFLMIWLNQPVYPILIGGLIALPGLALFVSFLRKYPLPPHKAPYE